MAELGLCKLSLLAILNALPPRAEQYSERYQSNSFLMQVFWPGGKILSLPKLYHYAAMNATKMNITHLQH